MNTMITILEPSIRTALYQVGMFIASLLVVLILILLGWLISQFIIKIGITKLLKVLKLDYLSEKFALNSILAKGGIKIGISELVGNIFYWLAMLITLVVAFNAAGLTVAADLLQKVVLFVPNIIAAVFVLIVGIFAAVLLKNLVRIAANNAGISQSNLMSNIAEVVVIVFTVAIALEQLQIGTKIIEWTINIILGSFGLGFAIAFGLGCKDIVGKAISDFLSSLKK